MADLHRQCSCGTVCGTLRDGAPSTVQYVVCHCDDCRVLVCHIGRAAARRTEHGGIPMVQSTPARYTRTEGLEQIGLIRWSPRGLLRFYATCCHTPMGNVIDKPGEPFVGVHRLTLPVDADALLGPKVGIHGRFATGDRSTLQADDRVPLSVLLRTAFRLGLRKLTGEARRSPFTARMAARLWRPPS